MGYFFQGWRRKSGMLSLVLALLLVVGWTRSFSMLDGVAFAPNQDTYIEVISKCSRISITMLIDPGRDHASDSTFQIVFSRKLLPPEYDDPHYRTLYHKHWMFCGLEYGRDTYKDGYKVNVWVVPYWSLVTPVTVLSAYLLLRNPGLRDRASRSTVAARHGD